MQLITYCSKNFEDVLATMIPSWISHYGHNIYIYTDCHLNLPNTVNQFIITEENNDRRTNLFRKIIAIDHHLMVCQQHFSFIDADCLVLSRFDEVFEHDFELGVTRFEPTSKMLSSGVLFFKPNQSLYELVTRWKQQTRELWKNSEIETCQQITLHKICLNKIFRVMNFPKDVYNAFIPFKNPFSIEKDEMQWKELAKQTPKIVHFQGAERAEKSRFRDIPSLINHFITTQRKYRFLQL